MTKESGLSERLRALEPPKKQRIEKWQKVEKYLAEIYEARDKRVTWKTIAETLADDGIVVKPVDLRVFISKIKRDQNQYPKPSMKRMSRKTIVRKSSGTRVEKPVVKAAVEAEEANKITIEPNPGSSPRHAATRSSREI